MRVCVVKRMKIDVPVQSIRERLSLLDIKKQNRDLYDYINELPVTTDESTIDGVVLVTHPLDDENGKPDSFERIAIVCIGVEYTIYKKNQGEVGEEEDNGSRLLRRGERRLRRTRHDSVYLLFVLERPKDGGCGAVYVLQQQTRHPERIYLQMQRSFPLLEMFEEDRHEMHPVR